MSVVSWTLPLPSLSVVTDVSGLGWGYQASHGTLGQGMWVGSFRSCHIIVRGLLVPLSFLRQTPSLYNTSIIFQMANQVAVQTFTRLGPSRSFDLQSVAEKFFLIVASRNIVLQAFFVPGRDIVWSDALSRMTTSSVEWAISPTAFLDLPTVSVSLRSTSSRPCRHRLPDFLTWTTRTEIGGPDAFTVDWSRWDYLCLFPPPSTKFLLRVMLRLQHFFGTGSSARSPLAGTTVVSADAPLVPQSSPSPSGGSRGNGS